MIDAGTAYGNAHGPRDPAPAPPDDPLALSFSRSLRSYVQSSFASQEAFLAETCINRGHFGAMARGKVDPKLSMLYRCTRAVGRCPSVLLCGQCVRIYGPCAATLLDPPPAEARTLLEIHAQVLGPRPGPGM
jgi:hypothetical protein